ncbi:MAG: FecR domain-containing protein [Niabella sp.]|nr:FecR domain-containing protein [Niabella sp.]
MPSLTREQVELLAEKMLNGSIDTDEQQLLYQWLNEDRGNTAEWNGFEKNEEDLKNRLLARIRKEAGIDNMPGSKEIRMRSAYWIAAAVAMFAILGILFYSVPKKKASIPNIANQTPNNIPAPATNRAMITLSNGRQVFLDSAGNGPLAATGNIKLVKLANGQIAYQATDGTPDNDADLKQLQYNTLTNPNGSKVIDVQLSDGSRVWLNAGSSVTYPVAFVGKERKVELNGEGYFEVAKNPFKKFVVTANGTTTEVLGTHFNINAYSDGRAVTTTLLEGSVKIGMQKDAPAALYIKPGQQAIVFEKNIKVISGVDVNGVIAWKNGLFEFKEADIKTIMDQLSRWYDLEVIYKGTINKHFGGTISRELPASDVFKMLELTGEVKFIIQGRKVIVSGK